jgi:hypothetical protein
VSVRRLEALLLEPLLLLLESLLAVVIVIVQRDSTVSGARSSFSIVGPFEEYRHWHLAGSCRPPRPFTPRRGAPSARVARRRLQRGSDLRDTAMSPEQPRPTERERRRVHVRASIDLRKMLVAILARYLSAAALDLRRPEHDSCGGGQCAHRCLRARRLQIHGHDLSGIQHH